MKFRLPVLLALLGTTGVAFGLLALPGRWATPQLASGKYVGLLTVRRALIEEGLQTTFTIKAEASVAADGRVTILTATPEAPGAATNIENSVVRAVPGFRNVTVGALATTGSSASLQGATTTPANPAQVGTVGLSPVSTGGVLPTFPIAILPGGNGTLANYLVNGTIPASLTAANRMVYLRYSVEGLPPGVAMPVTQLPDSGTIVRTSPADPSLSVNTSAASQTSSTSERTVAPAPVSRVSYEFALRFQHTLPPPTLTTLGR